MIDATLESERRCAWFHEPSGVWPGVLLLAACSAFASWACMRQFGSYDLSPLIDAFWRMRSGQVPGTDFINTFPLIIYLSAQLASYANLGWTELTLINVVHTAAAFGSIMLMTPREQRRASWSLVVAAVFALPLVYTNHVWHSSSSQLAGAVFLFAIYKSVSGSHRSYLDLGWVLGSAAVVALTKQNLALPMILSALVGVSAFGTQFGWRIVVSMFVGACFGPWFALRALGMRFQDFLQSYTAVGGRAIPSGQLWHAVAAVGSNLLVIAALVAAFVVMFGRMLRRREELDHRSKFLLTMVPATLCPLVTDWDTKINDIVLPLFLVCCWAWHGVQLPRATHPRRDLKPFALIVAVVFTIAVSKGATRERMEQVGPYAFWEPRADHRIAGGYFDGMHVGQRFARVLDEIHRLKLASSGKSLFFGPRLEFGYRVTGTPSPSGMPLWWHPGTSYGLLEEGEIAHIFTEGRFDTLIFLGRDRTRMPAQVMHSIEEHYARVPYLGELQIYKRKYRILTP